MLFAPSPNPLPPSGTARLETKRLTQAHMHTGKAEQAARRTERLSHRNPERLQRQIDDLRKAEESGQVLNARDKKSLEELEREVKAVPKAREGLGDKTPQFGSHVSRGDRQQGRGGRGGRGGVRGGADREGSALGKRRRGSTHDDGDGGSNRSTPESVRNIPMPRDTPPPIPPEFQHLVKGGRNTNPNLEPMPARGPRIPHSLPSKPDVAKAPPQAQTVYEAKPAVRNLQKEAVSAFMPAAVRRKVEATRGSSGRLLEPEEAEALEKEGYGGRGGKEVGSSEASNKMVIDPAPDVDRKRLEEEEKRFERELRGVEIEEVEDEDA